MGEREIKSNGAKMSQFVTRSLNIDILTVLKKQNYNKILHKNDRLILYTMLKYIIPILSAIVKYSRIKRKFCGQI